MEREDETEEETLGIQRFGDEEADGSAKDGQMEMQNENEQSR